MGSIQSKLAYTASAIDAIQAAIIAKGVSITSTTPLADYADAIMQIQGGGASVQTVMCTINGDGVATSFDMAHNFNLTDKDAFTTKCVVIDSTDTAGRYAILPVQGKDGNTATVVFDAAHVPSSSTVFKIYITECVVSGIITAEGSA